MKNITFSADEDLIEAARKRATYEQTTLNDEFRRWLADYAQDSQGTERAERALATIKELQKYVRTGGRKFTREEMNERR